MIDQLLAQSGSAIPTLERVLNFTEQRHNLLLADIANVSTPGYVQKDVSVKDFQKSLQDALQNHSTPQSNSTVEFSQNSSALLLHPQDTVTSTPFHDRGIRSMEYLMGNLADNATAHNMATQLLKNRYDILKSAITLRA